jgi:hypothetical protein
MEPLLLSSKSRENKGKNKKITGLLPWPEKYEIDKRSSLFYRNINDSEIKFFFLSFCTWRYSASRCAWRSPETAKVHIAAA